MRPEKGVKKGVLVKGSIRWIGPLAVLAASSTASAGGLGVSYVQESLSREVELGSYSETNGVDPSGYKIFGYFGDIDKSHFEISYQSISDTGEDEKTVDISWLLPFMKKANLIPHFKLGIGYGWTEFGRIQTNTGTRDDRYNFNLHAGLGATYMFTDRVGVRGTGEYLYRSWEKLTYNYSNNDLETTDTGFRLTAGVLYNF